MCQLLFWQLGIDVLIPPQVQLTPQTQVYMDTRLMAYTAMICYVHLLPLFDMSIQAISS